MRALSLCTCCRHYPGAAAGRSPRSSHPAVSAFPGRGAGSACTSTFSRLARRSLALRPAHSRGHRNRDPLSEGFRHFVSSMPAPVASGWSESPGGPCTHWKAPPCHGAHPFRTLVVSVSLPISWFNPALLTSTRLHRKQVAFHWVGPDSNSPRDRHAMALPMPPSPPPAPIGNGHLAFFSAPRRLHQPAQRVPTRAGGRTSAGFWDPASPSSRVGAPPRARSTDR